MNNFVLEVWDDEGRSASFYSIRKDGAADSETDKFFLRFENDPDYRDEIQRLLAFILDAIGEDHGAKEHFFRFEAKALALPPTASRVRHLGFDFGEFPLRLFCHRLSDNIVVLMNGGVKSSSSAQDSPDLHPKFRDANLFAKVIDQALQEKTIWIGEDGRTLESDDDDLVLFY